VGTVTVSDVVVAAVTVALAPPNQTLSFAAVLLKLVPFIVTALPVLALSGFTLVTVGNCPFAICIVLNKMTMLWVNTFNVCGILFFITYILKI